MNWSILGSPSSCFVKERIWWRYMDSLSRSLFNAVSKESILNKDWYEMSQGRSSPVDSVLWILKKFLWMFPCCLLGIRGICSHMILRYIHKGETSRQNEAHWNQGSHVKCQAGYASVWSQFGEYSEPWQISEINNISVFVQAIS